MEKTHNKKAILYELAAEMVLVVVRRNKILTAQKLG
jgi:hypothetical protein